MNAHIWRLQGVIPCDTPWDFPSSPVLVNASCMARTHHMYMVFNMGEVVNCSSSSDPGACACVVLEEN